MTDFTDFVSEIKSWVDRQDVSDSLVTSWIRIAEERINSQLRCKEMYDRARATISDSVTPLPTGWIELDYLRWVPVDSDVPDVKYGRPLHYRSPDQFYSAIDDVNHPDYRKSIYTIAGDQIVVNPISDGSAVEMGYLKRVEPFSSAATAVKSAYPSIYLFATLTSTSGYLVEDDRLAVWASQATAAIQQVTERYMSSRAAGSPLKARINTFG